MTRLLAVGDLMLGDSAASPGFGFASRYGSAGLGRSLAAVMPALAEADILFGNLEAVLSGTGVQRHRLASMLMRGAPRFAADLRAAGFTIVSVANNHAMQHGLAAFRETQHALEAAGILCCGLKGSEPWESAPAIVRGRDGSNFGFLGYCLRPRQYHVEETYPFAEGSEQSILRDVERLAGTVTAVVVSLHWGEEFVTQPSEPEADFARRLIAAGARIVIGHHPHVVRPVETRANGLIAYSLGNFIGDQVWHRDLRRGALLECVLQRGLVREARLRDTILSSRFAVRLTGQERAVGQDVPPLLLQPDYDATARERLSRMRFAKYRYALLNLWRNPRLLFQTGMATLRNRLKEAVT